MEDGALWGACDPQPLQQVGMFNGPDNQAGLFCHAESPYQPYWGSEAWTPSRPDEIQDIALMSPSLVDTSILAFDQGVLNLPVAGDAVHDFPATGNSRFSHHGQWGPSLGSADLYPTQGVQEILNSSFMQCNSPALALPHLPQDYNNFTKSFGTVTPIQPNRPVTSANVPTSQYGAPSMVPHNRAVASVNAPMTQYGSSSVVQSSMAMFAPSLPRGIVNTSGLGGGMNSNIGLMHLPKRHNTPSLAPKTGGDVTASDVGSGSGIATVPGASPFAANQKSSASVLMPLAESSRMHKMDTTSEEPKMASFNPGPYVNSARVVSTQKQQHEQQDTLASNRMWVENGLGKSSSVPIPNMGHGQQQAMSIMGFEPRQRMPSASPIPIMGFEQRQQQSMSSSSPTPNLGSEQRQQPTTSTSPTLSNLSFEPGQSHQQQPVSNPAPVPNLVFEPMRQQPNLTSNASAIPNLARQQPAASNPRSAIPDSGESASKWPAMRIAGGLGGSTGLPGSEKAPMMVQQPETGTLKCAIPRSSSVNTSPAVNANPVNKRPLYPDDNKTQGGSMTKKPLNKWQGAPGCSRLEEICTAAHQKVTQTTSGRALGPALNTNLKPRARQGSANDPQSIAARVRRERISDRLKVLQALIPNGDKVDMVTMLEKAINYVRCLELQIRMLKNDSLWPKALGPLPNTLQELLELAGPEFQDDKDAEETTSEKPKKTAPEVIEFDGNQPSADKE
jgi:hypothetical protein